MEYKKLLFNTWFKTYEIMVVSEQVYKNSPSVEEVGSMTGVKIKDLEHEEYLIKELKTKGFNKE